MKICKDSSRTWLAHVLSPIMVIIKVVLEGEIHHHHSEKRKLFLYAWYSSKASIALRSLTLLVKRLVDGNLDGNGKIWNIRKVNDSKYRTYWPERNASSNLSNTSFIIKNEDQFGRLSIEGDAYVATKALPS